MQSVAEIRSTLEKLSIYPSKALGQNFLLDDKTLRFIVKQAEIITGGGPHFAKATRGGENVLEIGPGLGVLTEALARAGANVYAVEKDKKLVKYLKDRFHNWKNVTIISDNALFFDPSRIAPYKLIANLPYSIASPILRKFLENDPQPTSIVVMVQKEVGERIVAPAGDSERGILSVMVQFYGKPVIVGHVARSKFWPQPDVDSVILKILVNPLTRERVNEKAFFTVVRAGFSKKRAQIHNALKNSLQMPAPDVSLMLNEASIDPTKRAEELTENEWGTLADAFQRKVEGAQEKAHS